jgi:hypothetical protein
LVVAAIACTLCIGWILAHPAQMRIGDHSVDLDAQLVDFQSGSSANIHGWWRTLMKAISATTRHHELMTFTQCN